MRRFFILQKFAILSFILLLTTHGRAADSIVLLKSAMIIDGTGAQAAGPLDIEITGSRISRIGADLNSPRAKVIDARGKFVTPGLIDCHTHLPSVPGSVFRKEDAQTLRAEQKQQLKSYLAAGVTTVLDAASPASLFSEVADFDKETDVPRFFGLAPFLTPEGGYFASSASRDLPFKDLWPPIQNNSQIAQEMEAALPLKSLGVKVTAEYGFGPFKVWPVFSDEEIRMIRDEAAKAGLPIFVHSERAAEFSQALKLKPYAFMHGGFFDEVPDTDLISKVKRSQAYVVSTLAIFKMMGLLWNRDLFNDPWFKMLVPKEQIQTALDPKVTGQVIEAMAVQNKPSYSPKFVARLSAGLFVNRASNEAQLKSSEQAVLLMYRSGIPIVMGSDAGNWPLLTTMFHGVGSILEIEALQEAGLPALEAIRAATSRAASMLKINREVGQVASGYVADLLVLNDDPTINPKAFRNIEYVLKGGVPKAPAEWLR